MTSNSCVVCGRQFRGVYFTTEQNERFCDAHVNPPRCRYCLHLLHSGEAEPCPRCLARGFSDITKAQPSIARVAMWMQNHVGAHRLLDVPVKLTDGSYFGPNQAGLTNWRHDGTNLDIEIEMLKHAQPNTFEPTLAHEYGHVILIADPADLSFTGGIGQSRLQEEEGFCEVLRYLWVSETGKGNRDLELKAISDNSDSLYGDGFRLMWPQYKAAGSIMNLRADMLGIPRGTSPKKSGWPFGGRNQPQPPAPAPIVPPTQPVPVAPGTNATPVPVVVEGGSHRPMIDLGFDKTVPKPVPPALVDQQRPTIDLSPAPGPKSSTPRPNSPAPSVDDTERPIIRFD